MTRHFFLFPIFWRQVSLGNITCVGMRTYLPSVRAQMRMLFYGREPHAIVPLMKIKQHSCDKISIFASVTTNQSLCFYNARPESYATFYSSATVQYSELPSCSSWCSGEVILWPWLSCVWWSNSDADTPHVLVTQAKKTVLSIQVKTSVLDDSATTGQLESAALSVSSVYTYIYAPPPLSPPPCAQRRLLFCGLESHVFVPQTCQVLKHRIIY